jgi:hypothetical protein
MMAEKGSQAIRTALQGKSPLRQGEILQEMLEGSYTPEGIFGPFSEKEKGKYTEDVLKTYAQEALNFSDDRTLQAMKFQSMMGVDIGKMAAGQQQPFLQELAGGMVSPETMKTYRDLANPASFETIAKSIEGIQNPVQEIVKILKDIAQLVGGGVLTLVGTFGGGSDLKEQGIRMVRAKASAIETDVDFMMGPDNDDQKSRERAFRAKAQKAAAAHDIRDLYQDPNRINEKSPEGSLTIENIIHVYNHHKDGSSKKTTHRTFNNLKRDSTRSGVPG